MTKLLQEDEADERVFEASAIRAVESDKVQALLKRVGQAAPADPRLRREIPLKWENGLFASLRDLPSTPKG